MSWEHVYCQGVRYKIPNYTPDFIQENKKIPQKAKPVIARIFWVIKKAGKCDATSKEIGHGFYVSESTVDRWLLCACDLGLFKKEVQRGGTKTVRSIYATEQLRYSHFNTDKDFQA